MCDQQSLRSACPYAQSDQSLCLLLKIPMNVRLLTEHHLRFLSLKGGCTGPSESTLVKMPHCWKSRVTCHGSNIFCVFDRILQYDLVLKEKVVPQIPYFHLREERVPRVPAVSMKKTYLPPQSFRKLKNQIRSRTVASGSGAFHRVLQSVSPVRNR